MLIVFGDSFSELKKSQKSFKIEIQSLVLKLIGDRNFLVNSLTSTAQTPQEITQIQWKNKDKCVGDSPILEYRVACGIYNLLFLPI